MSDERRTELLKVRLTPDELDELDDSRGDEERSDYVRRKLFGKVIVAQEQTMNTEIHKEIPKSSRPDHYCKAHHVMGCVACHPAKEE
jgi:hypothetical protein